MEVSAQSNLIFFKGIGMTKKVISLGKEYSRKLTFQERNSPGKEQSRKGTVKESKSIKGTGLRSSYEHSRKGTLWKGTLQERNKSREETL